MIIYMYFCVPHHTCFFAEKLKNSEVQLLINNRVMVILSKIKFV